MTITLTKISSLLSKIITYCWTSTRSMSVINIVSMTVTIHVMMIMYVFVCWRRCMTVNLFFFFFSISFSISFSITFTRSFSFSFSFSFTVIITVTITMVITMTITLTKISSLLSKIITYCWTSTRSMSVINIVSMTVTIHVMMIMYVFVCWRRCMTV